MIATRRFGSWVIQISPLPMAAICRMLNLDFYKAVNPERQLQVGGL